MKKLVLHLFCIVVLAMGLSYAEETAGQFPACYLVGGNMPGVPLFKVNVLVDTPTKTMAGHGDMTWTINPPLELKTDMKGGFVTVAIIKKAQKIVATLTGYPVVVWPPQAGIAPVQSPNVHLSMVLSSDWKTGTATFSFIDSDGKWNEINDAPVMMMERLNVYRRVRHTLSNKNDDT